MTDSEKISFEILRVLNGYIKKQNSKKSVVNYKMWTEH